MKIVFHNNTVDLLTYFTAQLYLNEQSSLLNNYLIIKIIKDFSKISQPQGNLIFIDNDLDNNSIYVLGRGRYKEIILRTLEGFSKIFASKEKIVFFDLTSYNNYFLIFAAILRQFKLSYLAQELFILGISKVYKQLLKDLEDFKIKKVLE